MSSVTGVLQDGGMQLASHTCSTFDALLEECRRVLPSGIDHTELFSNLNDKRERRERICLSLCAQNTIFFSHCAFIDAFDVEHPAELPESDPRHGSSGPRDAPAGIPGITSALRNSRKRTFSSQQRARARIHLHAEELSGDQGQQAQSS